jgi:hypothetical protein
MPQSSDAVTQREASPNMGIAVGNKGGQKNRASTWAYNGLFEPIDVSNVFVFIVSIPTTIKVQYIYIYNPYKHQTEQTYPSEENKKSQPEHTQPI